MCTKTCTKMIKTDSTGFHRIPLDSLETREIFPLKHKGIRAIPTLASNPNCVCSNGLRTRASATDTKTDTRLATP